MLNTCVAISPYNNQKEGPPVPDFPGFANKMWCGPSYTSLATDINTVEQKPIDAYPFTKLRITLVNYHPVSAISLADVRVACAPTDLNGGSTLTWVRATKNGSNTIVIPAATQGAGGTASNNRIVSALRLDDITISSVARTDTPGDPFLIQLRAKPSTGELLQVVGGPINRTNSSIAYLFNRGYKFGWQQSVSDLCTNPNGIGLSPLGTTSLGLIGTIEAFTDDVDHFSMSCFGDSLTGGYSGTADAGQCGWPNMVTYAMRTTGKIGGLANYGIGGMLQSNFYATMNNVIAASKPKQVYMASYSPNSGTSLQAHWDAQLAAFQAQLASVVARGIKCYVSNAAPLDNLTAPQDAMRVGFNAAVASTVAGYTAAQAVLWDFNSVIEDPGNLGHMYAAMNYDNIHQNLVGQQALADYVITQLGL
jgi:lysophospholipase L1-like esterase